jgi:hypothetical protein
MADKLRTERTAKRRTTGILEKSGFDGSSPLAKTKPSSPKVHFAL